MLHKVLMPVLCMLLYQKARPCKKFAAAAVRKKSVSLPHIIDMPVSLMPPHTDITDRL